MALVKCPECGCDISEQARNCPKCGHPIITLEKKIKNIYTDNSFRKKGIILGVIVFAFVFVIGISNFITEYQKGQAMLPVNQMKTLSQGIANGYLESYVSEVEYGNIKSEAQYIDSYILYAYGKDDKENVLNEHYIYEYYVDTSEGGIKLSVWLNNWDVYISESTGYVTLDEEWFSLYDSVYISKTEQSFNECKKQVKQEIKDRISEEPNSYGKADKNTVILIMR